MELRDLASWWTGYFLTEPKPKLQRLGFNDHQALEAVLKEAAAEHLLEIKEARAAYRDGRLTLYADSQGRIRSKYQTELELCHWEGGGQ